MKTITNYSIFRKINVLEKIKRLQKRKKLFVETRKMMVCYTVVLNRNTPKYFDILPKPLIPPPRAPTGRFHNENHSIPKSFRKTQLFQKM